MNFFTPGMNAVFSFTILLIFGMNITYSNSDLTVFTNVYW